MKPLPRYLDPPFIQPSGRFAFRASQTYESKTEATSTMARQNAANELVERLAYDGDWQFGVHGSSEQCDCALCNARRILSGKVAP